MLVDDLLDVSRVTTGRVHLRLVDCDLKEVIRRAVDSVQPAITQSGHELHVDIADSPIWLNADPARLEQVVVNLLSNSAKYTNPGGHIWIAVTKEGTEAVIRVKDTGIGIEPDLLPHIFKLFTQGKRTLDRSHSGLGIGLALVRSLVELHGGTVMGASEGPDKGSEFTVRIKTIAPPIIVDQTPEVVPAQAAPLRVLVVDDNVDGARVFSVIMEQHGHKVKVAHTGPEALELAAKSAPDVILLDIGLPDLDGYEVARRIREMPEVAGVVLVAVTGYGAEADRKRAMDAGFDHHLVKPVDFRKLMSIIGQVKGRNENP